MSAAHWPPAPYRPTVIPREPRVDTSWMNAAACKGLTSLFFPELGESNSTAAEAKQVCAACPVRVDCGDHANAAMERFGIWGGMSHAERVEARRVRRSVR